MSGILTRLNAVLAETMPTESSVSPLSNFDENIVVMEAVGAQQEIAAEISITPRTPQRRITATAAAGKTKSRSNTATMHLIFLNDAIKSEL